MWINKYEWDTLKGDVEHLKNLTGELLKYFEVTVEYTYPKPTHIVLKGPWEEDD